MNILLTLTSKPENSENFEVFYPNPIELQDYNKYRYEVALIGANIWFSWYNVSNLYNNNVLRYHDGALLDNAYHELVLPNGFYTIDVINDFLKENRVPIKFRIDRITSRCILKQGPDMKVDFRYGTLNKLLGFDNIEISEEESTGQFPINISNGVDRILIHCSIVGGSYMNELKSDVIYSFVPDTPPGSLISLNPNPPIYLPVKERSQINSINMKITDQNNNVLKLNDEPVTYMLNVKCKKLHE